MRSAVSEQGQVPVLWRPGDTSLACLPHCTPNASCTAQAPVLFLLELSQRRRSRIVHMLSCSTVSVNNSSWGWFSAVCLVAAGDTNLLKLGVKGFLDFTENLQLRLADLTLPASLFETFKYVGRASQLPTYCSNTSHYITQCITFHLCLILSYLR